MLILSPGPANISERVRGKLMVPDIGHRDEEFHELLRHCRELLLKVCGVSGGYSSVILNGSGTASIESVIAGMAGAMSGVLIVANGTYGDRAAEIAEVHGIPFEKLDFGWTSPIDQGRLEESILKTEMDAVYLVHHETTTGMLNPLRSIAAMAKSHGKWVLVDAVSSVCGEELDLEAWQVDLIIGSANKCIRGVPGASFVVLSDRLAQAFGKRRQAVYYNDLLTHIEKEQSDETPFTPPIQVIYAFREALLELMEEGVQKRITHYRRIAEALRDQIKGLGLDLLLPREQYSNTMTSVMLPAGYTYETLHDPLKEMGYLIYKGQGFLADKVFRLGTVGVMSESNILGFSDALRRVLGR